jgi:nucleolin
MGKENDNQEWKDAIIATLKGSSSEADLKVLRRDVLISLQQEPDKSSKKLYKKTIQALEAEGVVSLDADGKVTLTKKRKSKDEKKKKKKKRKKDETADNDNHKEEEEVHGGDQNAQDHEPKESKCVVQKDKNKPCKGNPQGVTRIFLGNLPFAVDETSLGAFLSGTVTHTKWITDKETGKFYGSAFCEMDTSEHAAEAVAMAGSQLLGRPIKINFAPAKEGDAWPPVNQVVSGGQAGGSGTKAMSEKPEGCLKLFIGNLSYDIDDDGIIKFFANVDAEVKAVRWLHHKESGDFKGCGFVEFWKTEACEKAATLNGKTLLGRPIRIDWSD